VPATRRPGHARVVFDDVLWHADLERASADAAAAAAAARGQLERHGAPIDQLRPCQEHGRDDTRLRGCLKLYVPPPAGPWGIVFQLAIAKHGAFLAVLAFGLRHPPAGRRMSVYQIAHHRLHDT
jgi:hypothetical protein